jgi:hypothetical protein
MIFRVLIVAIATVGLAVGIAPAAEAGGPYRNCTAAHQDGRGDIPQGDSDYWNGGDRDRDGIACEW